MTIVQQLFDDHAYFKETLEKLESLSSSPALEETILRASELVQLFRDRHRIHLRRESSVLFPALLGYLKPASSDVARSEIFHHLQDEHFSVGRCVYVLEQDLVSRPLSAKWFESYRDLAEAFLPHMNNEEEHIFPVASRLIPYRQLETMALSEFYPAF
ncbi:MAG: hemerythrin domain-containing protein [Elusimicrobia bacterium]|nr:hemerythrin domain-containing protein [Elusimicrobiota bacterium]